MKGTAYIIDVAGKTTRHDLTDVPHYKVMQDWIGGGPLEMVPKWTQYKGEKAVAFVDEDGKMKELPVNTLATAMWYLEVGRIDDHLVGSVLILTGDRMFFKNL